MFRIVLVAAAISGSSLTAWAADAIGIPVCDEFLAKYQACVTHKVPTDKRVIIQSGVDTMRKGWLELKDMLDHREIVRADVENACKEAPHNLKQLFDAFGCSLD